MPSFNHHFCQSKNLATTLCPVQYTATRRRARGGRASSGSAISVWRSLTAKVPPALRQALAPQTSFSIDLNRRIARVVPIKYRLKPGGNLRPTIAPRREILLRGASSTYFLSNRSKKASLATVDLTKKSHPHSFPAGNGRSSSSSGLVRNNYAAQSSGFSTHT